MPMWYVFGSKYNEHYTQKMDDHLFSSMAEPLAAKQDSSITEARTHGNPFYDQTTIIWQEDSSVMGKQVAVYRAEDAARSAGTAPAESGYSFKDLLHDMPGMWDQNGSFHIIDIDDPELVEQGEAYIHQQLTSYVAELDVSDLPEDSTFRDVRGYLEQLFVDGITKGWDDGLAGVIIEPFRQRMGYPYEWLGAPID